MGSTTSVVATDRRGGEKTVWKLMFSLKSLCGADRHLTVGDLRDKVEKRKRRKELRVEAEKYRRKCLLLEAG